MKRTFLTLLTLFALPALALASEPSVATFVPLTQFPGFKEVANAGTTGFAGYFNALYKFCIGAAAVLAVLQIMRAGVMYLGPDSISEKGEARSLMGWSIFGLLVVLAPTIVFGIIDKRILNLDLNLGALQNKSDTTPYIPSTNDIQVDKGSYYYSSVVTYTKSGASSGCFIILSGSAKAKDDCETQVDQAEKNVADLKPQGEGAYKIERASDCVQSDGTPAALPIDSGARCGGPTPID